VQLGVTTRTVLGTIIGTKTLSGEWAGKSKFDDTTPTVTTEPMTATEEPTPPKTPEPVATTGKPTPPETPEPKTPAPAAPKPDGADKKAGQLLRIAKSYLGAGMKPQALKKLNEIVAKYPKTESARAAKLLLANF